MKNEEEKMEDKKKALEAALSQIEKHFGKGAKRAETEKH
jgi:RecA/RadA recombinase